MLSRNPQIYNFIKLGSLHHISSNNKANSSGSLNLINKLLTCKIRREWNFQFRVPREFNNLNSNIIIKYKYVLYYFIFILYVCVWKVESNNRNIIDSVGCHMYLLILIVIIVINWSLLGFECICLLIIHSLSISVSLILLPILDPITSLLYCRGCPLLGMIRSCCILCTSTHYQPHLRQLVHNPYLWKITFCHNHPKPHLNRRILLLGHFFTQIQLNNLTKISNNPSLTSNLTISLNIKYFPSF